MISSKRLAASWLPFTLGAVTTALAFTLATGAISRPAVEQLAPPAALPAKPAMVEAVSLPPAAPTLAPTAAPLPAAAQPLALGSEPVEHPVAAPQAVPAAPAAPGMVLVTATPATFTMQPVAVTATAVLSPAEEAARTRAADEAMRQSTEALEQPGMPAQP
jgi:hypothetical protein